MAKITTTQHKRINLPHRPDIVQFVDGVAEVSDEVAAEAVEHYHDVVLVPEPSKPAAKPKSKSSK